MISNENILEIRARNFYEKKNNFKKYEDVKSIKEYGELKNVLITIVMPIYNHPDFCLERSLLSAINQKGFDNYQILLVDNDSDNKYHNDEVIKKMKSDKIVYFRNQQNIGMFGNWNRCIYLAKSEWICFLHSDDMIKENALNVLSNIVSNHPEIDQLACLAEDYNSSENSEELFLQYTAKKDINEVSVKRIFESYYYDSMYTTVKCALLKKNYMLELGGFRDLSDGIGVDDYICMLKYAHYYKTYQADALLYSNGWGENESLNTAHWYPEMIANYYMQKFVYKNKRLRFLYSRRSISMLYDKAKKYNSGKNFAGRIIPVDIDEMVNDCGIIIGKIPVIDLLIRKGMTLLIKLFREMKIESFKIKIINN